MRAKILYLVALAYFIAGFQVYQTKATTEQLKAADPTIRAHLDLLTLHQVGWLFMGTSVLAAGIVIFEDLFMKKVGRLSVAARKLREWSAGYTLMTLVIMFWTLLYFVSWVENGDWHAIYGIANYGLTAGILLICSRIVELPDKRGVALPVVHAAIVDDKLKQEQHAAIVEEAKKNGHTK